MSIHQDNFKNNLKLQLDNDPQLNGLDAFKKSLEKDYFSEVTIRNCSSDGSVGSLVIEMKCNIELVEVLFHYQKGTWGNKRRTRGSTTNNNNSFSRMFSKLKKVNSLPIDVEELSIFLNDSSIIIKKIYDQSVGEEFGTIIDVVAENYVHITKGLTETPYEIYIPVFEENAWGNENMLSNQRAEKISNKDYFSFWGLYFDSEEDAVIYDLSNKSFISGDLYMLNH
jgi:hypothetical protein